MSSHTAAPGDNWKRPELWYISETGLSLYDWPKFHPIVQSVSHPSEQNTEYQIKFMHQGNGLFFYLIGS